MEPDALSGDFWKQFIASLVRKALFSLGALLESYGYFTHDQAVGITTTAVVAFVTGVIIQLLILFWQYAKTNFNIEALKKAVQTTPPAGDSDFEIAQAVKDVKAEVSADKTTTTAEF